MKALREQFEYILEDDRDLPAAQQTVFVLASMKADKAYALQDGLVETTSKGGRRGGESRSTYKTGTQERDTLLTGILDIRNAYEADGTTPILWPADPRHRGDRMVVLDKIAPRYRRELFEAITGDAGLDEIALGESDSPSGSD